jgi:hypothetical protein
MEETLNDKKISGRNRVSVSTSQVKNIIKFYIINNNNMVPVGEEICIHPFLGKRVVSLSNGDVKYFLQHHRAATPTSGLFSEWYYWQTVIGTS